MMTVASMIAAKAPLKRRAILDVTREQRTVLPMTSDFMKNAHPAIESAFAEHAMEVQKVTDGVFDEYAGQPVEVVRVALVEAGWPDDQSATQDVAQAISEGTHVNLVADDFTW